MALRAMPRSGVIQSAGNRNRNLIRHGSVINVHYTAHHINDLKAGADKADFRLQIGRKRQHGFPVIHLGSSNILMAPCDRYLCIMPGAVSKASAVAQPFDGDNRLSMILSKALILAEDDQIKASDIVSQLKRSH
ncbi:DUF7737 domain-containing protein [Candidatus Rhodobacter oscarellae]|uniref:DUF7737 domain-containing protein n=1 Tax=Candidatus Rhodobacter oscarellae TaxID=1675527 RepID=UPI000670E2B4|nr:hypothetical protein [Candidatus Rhodobacter lobularis]